MNNQQAFDTIVKHLRVQNTRAMNDGICRYRDPTTGGKCAVGALIPDTLYETRMECNPIDSVLAMSPKLQEYLAEVSEELLIEMLDTHDNYGPAQWEERFTDIARRFFLTVPVKE